MTPDIRQLDKVEKVGRIFRLTFTDGDSINTGDSGPLHHRLDGRPAHRAGAGRVARH